MNILIGTNHLHAIGGSEVFTYYLVQELKKYKDIENLCLVVAHKDYLGVMSDRIEEELGVKGNKIPKDFIKGHGDKFFDVCLLNHNTTIQSILQSPINIKENNIFQIVHGTVPGVEQPYLPEFFHENKDLKLHYIAISEEIKYYLKNEYQIESEVIHNGIDCEKFKLEKENIKDKPKRVLSLSQSKEFNEELHDLMEEMDLEFDYINKWDNPVWGVEQAIKKCDIVISLGRGAYEGMAAGKFVIIADKRNYQTSMADGAIKPENIKRFLENNCSGRAMRYNPTMGFIENEIKKYDPKDCFFNRKFAEKNLNLKIQVSKIMKYIYKNKE